MKDREWKRSANPDLWTTERQQEESDLTVLEKKKKQKILQYKSLAEQYQMKVKQPRLRI